MKILAVGDIVGNNGVEKLKKHLKEIRKDKGIDFVIVNAENSAEGMGITTKQYNQIVSENVDCITMGNHTFGKKDIFTLLEKPELIIPANYPNCVGKGYNIYKCLNKKIAVINLLGRVDINILTENPFLEARKIIDNIKDKVDVIVVDFHAEATAEKIAFANYLNGDATIVFGTHTHVQTADERILPNGTAYITDLGMTGPKNSVIGMDISASVKRFATALPEKYRIAEGESILNAVVFDVDNLTNKVTKIERIRI